MQLIQEAKIRTLSLEQILDSAYEKPSMELSKIYENIQRHCTDDSIRIWSKTIMISHLIWKYDCICNEKGKYGVYEEYLEQADVSDRAKRYYNYGTIYRETTASQFIKLVMTEHYPLSDEFKSKNEFKEIIDLL